MSRSVKSITVLFASLLMAGLLLHSFEAQATERWVAVGQLQTERAGACSVQLTDGRTLITGGESSSGVLSSAEVFDSFGSSTDVAAMLYSHADHVCAALEDGRVLVAGGRLNGTSPSNIAEVYDPAKNAWSLVSTMMSARIGATASVLKNGRVLIAGGDNGASLASLESFDPSGNRFELLSSSLSAPRKNHAAAVLGDGRVLFAGGLSNSEPLDTVEVFDPKTGGMDVLGRMSAPRSALSATTLLDGTVLLAGGLGKSGDLALVELVDAQKRTIAAAASLPTARHGQQAVRLPDNNAVLFVGGSSAGADAQVYIPWQGRFKSFEEFKSPRRAAKVDLASGARALSAQTTSPTDSVPTLATDKADYSPGQVVTITGTGFLPGETVKLHLEELPPIDSHPDLFATVAADGTFSNNEFSPDVHDTGITFALTALGETSGLTAQTNFTDGNPNMDTCENGPQNAPVGCTTSSDWGNGSLNGTKAHYLEGDSVPVRISVAGLAPTGSTGNTLTFSWDTTDSAGKHGFDFLTDYNRTETTANPCAGTLSSCASIVGPPANPSTFPIPTDGRVLAAEGGIQIPGNFYLFGGTITGVSAYSYTGPDYLNASTATLTVTFTATADNQVLAFGAHVSRRLDWNASAVDINGSPYHISLGSSLLNGNTVAGGGQFQLQASAVIFPGSITIIKQATPEGSTSFPFTSATLGNFNLVDNGTTANTKTVIGITTFQDYSITENTPAGWQLDSISCSVTSPNNGSHSENGATTTITLKEGENWTCTFNNSIPTHTVTLVKHLSPTSDGGKFDLTAAAVTTTNQGNNGQAQDTNVAVGASVTVSEIATTGTGTDLNNYTSVLTCSGVTITTSTTSATFTMPNNNVSCTVTNTRKTHAVKLTKSLVPNTDAGRFDLTAAGTTVQNLGDTGFAQNTSVAVGTTGVTVSEIANVGNGADLNNYTSVLTCSGVTIPTSTTSASFTMPDNDVTCAVTNTRKTHSVTLTKQLSPTTDTGLFDLTAAGTTATAQGHNGQAQNSSVAVGASVSVSEIANSASPFPLADYTSLLTCSGATIPTSTTSASFTMPDNDVTCTVTNTRKTHAVTLTKVLSPSGDTGRFDLTAAGTTVTNQGNGGSASNTAVAVGATSVTVSEIANAGSPFPLAAYTSVLTCSGVTISTSTTSASFTMPDNDVTCTVTNTRKTHAVTLTKVLSPSGDTGRFDLTAAGTTVTNQGNGGSASNTAVAVGATSVTVSEIANAGSPFPLAAYTSVLTCSGVTISTSTTSASFTMPDNDVTCTVTNTRKTHAVTLTKVLSPSGDTGRFDLTAAGTTVTNQGNGGSASNTAVPVGATSVTVSEIANAGSAFPLADYTSVLACSGVTIPTSTTSASFTMPDNDVSCTVTNTRKTHRVTLNKVLVPSNDPGVFNLTAAGATANNQGNGGSASNTVAVGTAGVSVSEAQGTSTLLANYSSSLSCSNGTTGTTSASFTMPDADVTCTLTNSRRPTLTVTKKVLTPTTDTGLFNLQIGGTSYATNVGNNGSTGAIIAAIGASPSIGETAGTSTNLSSYTASVDCGAGSISAPSNFTGGTLTSVGPLAAGQNVSCVITNTKQYAKVVKTVNGLTPGPNDPAFTFDLKTGASVASRGTQLQSLSTGNGVGTLTFSYLLVPGTTYNMCEQIVPGYATTLSSAYPIPDFDAANPNPGSYASEVCSDFTPTAGGYSTFTVNNFIPSSNGLGSTIGFWKNWASCANSKGSQAPRLDQTLARSMGVGGTPPQFGPAYFQGITVGKLILKGNSATPNVAPDCLKAVDILNKSTTDAKSVKEASDPGFNLAAQLLGAMLNVDVGAAVNCQDDKTAINYAIALLAKYGFDGSAPVAANNPGYHALSAADAALANTLATILDDYNNNMGCPGSGGVPALPSLPNIAPIFTTTAGITLPTTGGVFYVEAVGAPQVTLSVVGSLPAGVTFTQVTPWVSFTPAPAVGLLQVAAGTVAGTYPITFSATNSAGTVTQSFTLKVQ